MIDRQHRIPVSDLAPISLDQLVIEAELLTRFDRKYVVPTGAAVTILRGLDPRSRVLEIDRQRSFEYDSVYFDTLDFLSYRLTAQRRRRRFKLRTRTYVSTGGSFLEVKTKDGRGNTVKQRIPVAAADRERLSAEGRMFAAEALQGHGHDAAIVDRLRPALTNRYRRTTLLLPCGSRATIDIDLVWASPDGREIRLDDHVVIESKAVQRASALDTTLWRAGFRPTGMSKFGIGTAALHPELPSNKWARLLRGPLAQTTNPAK